MPGDDFITKLWRLNEIRTEIKTILFTAIHGAAPFLASAREIEKGCVPEPHSCPYLIGGLLLTHSARRLIYPRNSLQLFTWRVNDTVSFLKLDTRMMAWKDKLLLPSF